MIVATAISARIVKIVLNVIIAMNVKIVPIAETVMIVMSALNVK